MMSTPMALVSTVDWASVRSILGASDFVPGALERLLRSSTQEAATAAYWELDNRVVVQGQLFGSSKSVIAPLLAALGSSGLSSHARSLVVDLLVEIALGVPDQSEVEAGNESLADQCREELRRGLWCLYGLLDDGDERVQLGAIDILEVIEPEPLRLAVVARSLLEATSSVAVRVRTEELLG